VDRSAALRLRDESARPRCKEGYCNDVAEAALSETSYIEARFIDGSSVQFFPTPDNPVPHNPTLVGITTRDGVVLRVAHWRPTTRAVQGTVCILQGRAEFIEKYFEVVRELRERGFAVVAFDWRGQGHSGRQVGNPRKGHVRRFEDYRLDLEAIRDHVLIPHMPEPHFALAHSMGGAIALQAAADGELPFRRLVTTAPMIGLCLIKPLRTAAFTAQLLSLLGLGKSFVPGGGETSIERLPFAGNRLTGDPVRYARNADAAAAVGHGAVGAPTVAWIHSAFRFMKRFTDPRFGIRVRVPTLIIAAGADPVCSTPAIERLAARLKAGHAIVLPGARHEILMERDAIRDLFWAAFDAFVPGSPDRIEEEPGPRALEIARWIREDAEVSAAEELEGRGMDAAVARRDDRAAVSR
jgi:lysophospholipase